MLLVLCHVGLLDVFALAVVVVVFPLAKIQKNVTKNAEKAIACSFIFLVQLLLQAKRFTDAKSTRKAFKCKKFDKNEFAQPTTVFVVASLKG